MTLLLVLSIVGLVIMAVGALLALRGEVREDGHVTRTGRISAGLVMIGLVMAVTLQVLQVRHDQDKAERAAMEVELQREWEIALGEPIDEVGLTWLQRKEVPVDRFLADLGSIQVNLVLDEPFGVDRPRRLMLTTRRPAGSESFEPRLVVLAEAGETLEVAGSGDLLRKVFIEDLSDPSRPFDLSTWDGWPYMSSDGDEWNSPDELTDGFRGGLRWERLELGSEHSSLGDLSRINQVFVRVGDGVDFARTDALELWFHTADGQDFVLDLQSLNYIANASMKYRSATGSGFQLLSNFEENFRLAGGRRDASFGSLR